MSKSVPATVVGSHRADSLASSVAILLGMTVLQRAVGLVRSVLFCRWLDTDQLGQWDLTWGFLMLAAPLALLGVPGSFGRYVETYRQQGHLRTFLARTIGFSVAMTAIAVVLVALNPAACSELIFGRGDQIGLVYIMAGTLGAVMVFNFLTSLFTALRRYRVVSAMQFVNAVGFAAVAILLLAVLPPTAGSVAAAYGIACVITAIVGIAVILPLFRELPPSPARLSHATLWAKLLPFAFWLWMMNWISNVFEIVDRFMIVHYANLSEHAALELVGQYHSARVFPALFIGVGEMLTNMITPHLSADWEAGRREQVSARLNTIVKLFGFSLVVLSAGLLIVSPLLFGVLLKHKFTGGLEVLPWTMVACIWFSMNAVSNNYLWCAERSKYITVTMGAGLVANIALDAVLLPAYGLTGVGVASAISRAVTLGLLWAMSSRLGWKVDPGLIFVAALAVLLPVSPWLTLFVAGCGLAGLMPSLPCIVESERLMLATAFQRLLVKFFPPREPTAS